MAIEIKPLEKVNFTVKEAAKILSISVPNVYALINNGSIRCMKLPTATIPYFEIERFMRQAIDEDIDYREILSGKKSEVGS